MEIILNAPAYCESIPCGRVTRAIIDPRSVQVTHLVVKTSSPSPAERRVPIELFTSATSHSIRLSCTTIDLESMLPFAEVEWRPVAGYAPGPLPAPYLFQTLLMRPLYRAVKRQRIRPGELAVHRGTRVHFANGREGRMEKLVLNQRGRQISHLVLRTGSVWGSKRVTVPIARLDRIDDDVLLLGEDKRAPDISPPILSW